MENKFKSGDRIKFLNEVGGGVIKGFDSKGFAIVETLDGFDIPYATKFLIHEHPPESAESLKIASQSHADQFLSFGILPSINIYYDDRNGKFSVGLNNPLTKKLNISIHIFEEKKWKSLVNFEAEKGVKIFHRADHFNEICKFDKLMIQYMEIGDFSEEMPLHLAFKIKIPAERFASFTDWPIDLSSNTHCLEVHLKNEEKKAETLNSTIKTKEKSFYILNQNKKGEYEIDLHNYALPDFYQTDDISMILKRQLAFFEKCIDEAIIRRIRVLHVIHGTGEGILKQEVRDRLTALDAQIQDAPMNIYGVGATTVRFKI